MSGETSLEKLLATMAPALHPDRHAFRTSAAGLPAPDNLFAAIHEDEGTTHIYPDPAGDWARITLTVHSSLEAVGLTAAFARALADAGISANVIAGIHHDHIFVPWQRRDDGVQTLRQLATSAQ